MANRCILGRYSERKRDYRTHHHHSRRHAVMQEICGESGDGGWAEPREITAGLWLGPQAPATLCGIHPKAAGRQNIRPRPEVWTRPAGAARSGASSGQESLRSPRGRLKTRLRPWAPRTLRKSAHQHQAPCGEAGHIPDGGDGCLDPRLHRDDKQTSAPPPPTSAAAVSPCNESGWQTRRGIEPG